MIHMYKIKNGLVRLDTGKLFTPPKTSATRGHKQRVFKTHATKNVRRNSFSQRVVNDWNGLPNHVVYAPTLNTFKQQLDECWCDHRYETNC